MVGTLLGAGNATEGQGKVTGLGSVGLKSLMGKTGVNQIITRINVN